MREFSIAFHNKDIIKISHLFSRYIPFIYASIAFFTVFLAFNSEEVSYLFGGREFLNAQTAITIMAFYPLHQTYGQLSGSLFYATNNTKAYRNITIFTSVIGLFFTFILIVPARYHGLGLGATGLAYKMVVLQFVGVNMQLWYNTKFLNISFYKFLSHQIYTVLFFLIIAFIAMKISDVTSSGKMVSILISGFIYTLLSIILVYIVPAIIAMSRNELNDKIVGANKYIIDRIFRRN